MIFGILRLENSRGQGFEGSRGQGIKGSKVQKFKSSKVQEFKSSRVQRLKALFSEGSSASLAFSPLIYHLLTIAHPTLNP
jgi:hypothetical protein